MPYNYICVQSGSILAELQSLNDIFDTKTVVKLSFVAFVVLIVGYFRNKSSMADNERTTLMLNKLISTELLEGKSLKLTAVQ